MCGGIVEVLVVLSCRVARLQRAGLLGVLLVRRGCCRPRIVFVVGCIVCIFCEEESFGVWFGVCDVFASDDEICEVGLVVCAEHFLDSVAVFCGYDS